MVILHLMSHLLSQGWKDSVTQLGNIGGLKYIDDDFQLIKKLVMKLPFTDQRLYADHITSEGTNTDSTSRWNGFWC